MTDLERQEKVSVILPIFYGEERKEDMDLLCRALDSVQSQRFPSDYEILIIDDGSITPIAGLATLLGRERLQKVRFIRLARNGGLAKALNRGLIEARYPLIARIDADDRWLEGKIDKQFALLKGDQDITIAATGMTLVDTSGKAIEEHIRAGDWNGILRFFVEVGCPFPHGSVIARRDVYRLLGGYTQDPVFSHCEDYALWGIWLRFFKGAMVEEALYDYTVSENSVSALYREQQQLATAKIKDAFSKLDLIEKLPRALFNLSSVIGCSITEAGMLAYKMWRFGVIVRLPAAAQDPLAVIMPDRRLIPSRNGGPVLDAHAIIGRPIAYGNGGRLAEIRAIS